ncbi:hypothetical protein [Dietzia aerolata]|uniref:Uncharacterized protein n=1 Tax=Dietzia aerolata TaxID=595984 RepID=A0ABV5JMR6_9ACTN|nr:hypothetical protein [Dietzia aerolata]
MAIRAEPPESQEHEHRILQSGDDQEYVGPPSPGRPAPPYRREASKPENQRKAKEFAEKLRNRKR